MSDLVERKSLENVKGYSDAPKRLFPQTVVLTHNKSNLNIKSNSFKIWISLKYEYLSPFALPEETKMI